MTCMILVVCSFVIAVILNDMIFFLVENKDRIQIFHLFTAIIYFILYVSFNFL